MLIALTACKNNVKETAEMIDLFPDKLPAEVSDNLKAMTVRDLLTMTCQTRTPSLPLPPTTATCRASSTSCGSAFSPYYKI